MFPIAEIELRKAFFVIFFAELLIEEAVFFLTQVSAAKAIRAASAIEEESTVSALLTQLTVTELKAILTIGAVIAALAFKDFRAIDTRFAVVDAIAVN